MRKTVSALALGTLAVALAGCASNAPGTAAAGAGVSQTTAVPTDTQASTSTPTTVATSAATTPAAKKTTSAPTGAKTGGSSPGSHKPTPGSAPTSFGYSPTADAKAQIDAARTAAKADGREVLLDFGAGWCGNCVAMDAAFHTSQVRAELAAAYHLVQVDVDVSANMNLLTHYAPSNSGSYGLPVLIILSPDGSTRVDTDKSGNPGFDTSSFLAFLKKWAP